MNTYVKDALKILKDKGIRVTPQRNAILTYLYNTDSHPTADEIYKALEKDYPNMSVATVYNNLKTFLDADLIDELLFGDYSSRFEIKQTHHYHIICIECKSIEDFISSYFFNLEEVVSKEKGFLVDNHKVEFYGICNNCQKK